MLKITEWDEEASVPESVAQDLQFPRKMQFLFRPKRYKVAHGGRGGLKSWNFARALLLSATQQPGLTLCARELQTSIADSVHRLLCNQIELMNLGSYFEVTQQEIRRYPYPGESRGHDFIFAGVKNNPNKIKSTEGIRRCWVEEAEKVSKESWEILIPTVREPGSEIWVSYNPDEEEDPTHQRFIINPPSPDDCIVVETNWRDNPWLSDELKKEKDYLARVDPDAYHHVWEGKCRTNMSAQIFRGKYIVESFEPPAPEEVGDAMWDGPYYGLDFGFANDPLAFLKMWINGRKLMVEYEKGGIGIELDDIPEVLDQVPEARQYTIRADGSRPETISKLCRHGFRCEAADKWSGSVEDGIAFLRAFEQIVIHPRCKRTIEEAKLYSYKRDRLTGDVLAEVVDKHNHTWDAIRYAMTPMIQRAGSLGIWAALAR